MPISMAQQEPTGGGGGGGGGGGQGGGGGGGGVRRRSSLESPMKESQARTKVVLRHLPPSISDSVLLEHIDSKFAGCYTWFTFRPGKASVKRQVPSRAYINFKKPEDVYDFSEHMDGHMFVNEKGAQYKVSVEYAPYQRIPKPRSKKDIREGTIAKDPDYLEFLETLGKPIEFLPSAEVQLERREAEKAALGAGGGKEAVVTPLMEFVRQRRAAKSVPQRALSSKPISRSGGVSVATSNSASHKRGPERSRAGSHMDFKEVQARDHSAGQRREEQRKEREVVIERRRKEITGAKERKLLHGEAASVVNSGVKGNPGTGHLESSKENTHIAVLSKDSLPAALAGESTANEGLDLDRELSGSHMPAVTGKLANDGLSGDVPSDHKREVLKRKQLSVMKEKLQKDAEGGSSSPGQASGGGGYNQRHRPPVSPRVPSPSTHSQLATSGEGSTVAPVKQSHRGEVSGRGTSRGASSPRDQLSPSHVTLLVDSPSQQQGSPQPAERVGKRPPRPQHIRMAGKEQAPSLASSAESDQTASAFNSSHSNSSHSADEKLESFSGSERQDPRRVRNKDRPDRPVWTPRRRSDTVQSPDSSPAVSSGVAVSTEDKNGNSKPEKSERGPHKQVGKAISAAGQNSPAESKGTDGAAGAQQADGGGKTHSSQAGKVRHVESGSTRLARGGRTAGTSNNAPANLDHAGATNQGAEQRIDSSVPGITVDPKGSYNGRENGEIHISSSVADKEKRKQDDLTGGSHRSGDRRRERSGQHNSKDGDGSVVATEQSKPVKRGGGLALGSNEKQVWVAVQKPGTWT